MDGVLPARSNLLAKSGDCFSKERFAMTIPVDFKKTVLHKPGMNTEGEKCAIMVLPIERGKSIAQAQDDRNRFFNLLAGCLWAIPTIHPDRAPHQPGSPGPKLHLHRDAVVKDSLPPGNRLLR